MAKIELYSVSLLQKDSQSPKKAATERNGLFNQCAVRTKTNLISVPASLALRLLLCTVTPDRSDKCGGGFLSMLVRDLSVCFDSCK